MLRILGCTFCLAAAATGQLNDGALSGYVLDPARHAIPRAQVRILDARGDRARELAADGSGFYSAAALPAGDYIVSASAPGLLPARSSPVAVAPGAHIRLDLILALPAERTSVEVAAQPTALSTESSELGTVIPPERIGKLLLNRRDFLQLALLAAGVLPPVQDSELSTRGRFAMHAGGAREEANNFLLDGADNNDPYNNTYTLQPPVDAVEEFQIATSGFSAEYGRSGGGQVNVVTRSGGSRWHGDAYEYLRNRDLDGRNFFDSGVRPEFARNEFGGSAGGPLRPGRTFLFANFDELRERRALTRLATVPTLAQRLAVPAARASRVGLAILDLFPLPNLPGESGNYLAQPVLRDNNAQAIVRLDHRLSARDQLTARYAWGNQDLFEPYTHDSSDVPGFGDYVANVGHGAAVQYDHTLSPRAINSVRAAFNRIFRRVRAENFNRDAGTLWSVDWLKVQPRDFGFPQINVAGYSLVGDQTQLPISRTATTYEVGDTLAMVRGSHTLKTGGEIRNQRFNGLLDYYARGLLSFSGAITGSGISDLLLGFPSFAIQATFDNPEALRSTAYAAFLQDDWKIAPALTLNLGVRYEYNTPPTDPQNRMSVFVPSRSAIVRAGSADVSRSGIRPDRDNVAPRAGFAWSPFARTVVRGAFGIYYDSDMLEVNTAQYFNPPWFNVRAFFPSAGTPLTLDNPFLKPAALPPSANGISPDLTTAYLEHWNLDVQREIGAAQVSVAYAGTRGVHLVRSRDLNQPAPGPGALALRRPLPAFGGIFFSESAGNSTYHSLQASLDRRLSHGVSLLFGYTFGKSIDDASAYLVTKADKNFPQNSNDLRAERALSSYDIRHRATAAYVWLVPARHRWTRNLELRGIAVAQTGQPFTPYLRFDNSNTGNSGGIFGLDRPDLLREPNLAQRGPERWFDTAAFAIPARYHFGSAGRNILRGPGLFSMDAALSRRFALGERAALLFDAEVFNLLNHTNFDLPEPYADQPATFGKIFSAKAPRQIQFALRLSF